MAGIYGIFTSQSFSKPPLYKDFYNFHFSNAFQEEIKVGNNVVGRSVIDKFHKDRFLYQDDSFLVCFEGINYAAISSPEKMIEAFRAEGIDFVKRLKGVFSGFLLDKKEGKLFIYTDPLATKKIYYYHSLKDGLVFSSEMHVLSKYLRDNSVALNYDFDGIYSLALHGQMFNNYTVVKEISRLGYASILEFNLHTKEIKKEQYYVFKKAIVPQKLSDIIENIDALIGDAVQAEWKKDRDNGYSDHLTLISGGMDSRINALLAKNQGFSNIHGYTYGDPSSSDVKIAEVIAKDNFCSHLQYNLNNGDFLMHRILEDHIKPSDGLTHFTANAIVNNALKSINLEPYGILHSGQLGDTVSGSFLKPNYDFVANSDKIGLTGFVKNKSLLKKITSFDTLLQKYQHSDYEIYGYEQRQVNGTLMGDSVFSNFMDQGSPFYDMDLLNYILTIPNEFKKDQKIYFSWLQKKHPYILDYKWEKLGMKPNSSFNIKYGRLIRKYVNGGKKYFNLRYDSMNPIGIWLTENPKILQEFDNIFSNNIENVTDEGLREDLRAIYKDHIFAYRNKFGVLTVLLSLKLHFGY